MNEHSVQVVISEPGGRQVRVKWQGTASEGPLVLQVAAATPSPPRHAFFPAAAAALEAPSAAPALSVELLFPGTAATTPSAASTTSPLSLSLRWSEPAQAQPEAVAAVPVPVSKPPSEPAPLSTAWAVERLRQRHLASTSAPARRRVARAAAR